MNEIDDSRCALTPSHRRVHTHLLVEGQSMYVCMRQSGQFQEIGLSLSYIHRRNREGTGLRTFCVMHCSISWGTGMHTPTLRAPE